MRSRATIAVIAALGLSTESAHAAEAYGAGVYYLGDLHAHTGYSGDGGSADLGDCTGDCGNFSDFFTIARANGLDFVAMTDHVNSTSAMSASDFLTVNAAVLAADDPSGGFVTIPAGEVWFTLRGTGTTLGHKTLLLFDDDSVLAPLTLSDVRPSSGSGVSACADIWTWMDTLTASYGPALLLPHHPSALHPMPTDWSCHDATYQPAVEIYSEHGNGLESSSGWDQPGDGVWEDGTAEAAIDPAGYGLTLGFVGGTDSHDTQPGGVCALDTQRTSHLYGGGLTVAVLDPSETFDRAALYDAIVDRHTYVTTGPMLPVELGWSALGVPLGGLGDAIDAPRTIDLDVSLTVPLDRAGYVQAVEAVGPDAAWPLVDDGAGNWSVSIPAGDVPAVLYVAVQIDGAAWYGATPCDDGGADSTEWLWLSPSPITLWDDDEDGDGSSVLDGDCDDGNPAAHEGALEVWYDGVDEDCDDASDYDADGDGADTTAFGGPDCDDTRADIHPGAPERWYDGVDQDCASDSDYDADADGFDASAWGGDDCDDADAAISPAAVELFYDGVDQDCDGASDYDADRDGEDDADWGGLDCDDATASISPDVAETWYDGVDEDCSGGSDYDADGDAQDALAWGGTDCDDAAPATHAYAIDIPYDGIDQDCTGADERDADHDGHADAAHGGDDCDDGNVAIHPGAPDPRLDCRPDTAPPTVRDTPGCITGPTDVSGIWAAALALAALRRRKAG